ncbi:hypothetical protein Poli38472_009553 [Pythium oligandrum]|uniref:Uncharacterized protein n=1 Tax=Pythium oligandrum TaxID=41045 RepID=A0A8K1CFZ4_PYTOL|nr:hypothetical protein Poli38472_009553 [Pythium oligandrum]|eukprot:TMW62060.1 hypothetical protein Poli38472_009553 [Pythium oligandrum]
MTKDKMNGGDNYGVTMGTWEVGFFGCFNDCIPNCCMVWCLPCVSLAQISARLGVYKYGTVLATTFLVYAVIIGIPLAINISNQQTMKANNERLMNDEDYWADIINNDGQRSAPASTSINSTYVEVFELVSAVFGVMYCIFVWKLRSHTRARFEIPGNPCVDCLASCCCSCCAIAQMATHSKSYKPGSCEFGPPDTLPAFK